MPEDERLSSDEITRFVKAARKTLDGRDSNLFLVWDMCIDGMISHFVSAADYAYVNPEMKIGEGWKERLEALHTEVNRVKDLIADNKTRNPELLPTKVEFKHASQELYKWFDPNHEVGKFSRTIIEEVFTLLELGPVQECGARLSA